MKRYFFLREAFFLEKVYFFFFFNMYQSHKYHAECEEVRGQYGSRLKAGQVHQYSLLTSVHLMTFPFALYSDPWNIFTFVIDSMDLPSIGLTTLQQRTGKEVSCHILLPNTKHALLKTSAAYISCQDADCSWEGVCTETIQAQTKMQTLCKAPVFRVYCSINRLLTHPALSLAFLYQINGYSPNPVHTLLLTPNIHHAPLCSSA